MGNNMKEKLEKISINYLTHHKQNMNTKLLYKLKENLI